MNNTNATIAACNNLVATLNSGTGATDPLAKSAQVKNAVRYCDTVDKTKNN
jgi:hypothetical protein